MKHSFTLLLVALAYVLTACSGDSSKLRDHDWPTRYPESVVVSPFLSVGREKDGDYFIRKDGKKILKNIEAFGMDYTHEDSLGSYKANGKWGYYHAGHGVGVIPPSYIRAYPFSEGKAAVLNEAGWLEFIDRKGKVVISFPYTYRGDIGRQIAFSDGRCTVAGRDGKYGVVDGSGEWIIPPEYDNALEGREYAVVSRDGVNRLVTYDGTVLNELVMNGVHQLMINEDDYEYSSGEASGFYEYNVGGRVGLMDADGNRLTEPLYEDIEALSGQLFKARLLLDDELYVLLNGKGETIR